MGLGTTELLVILAIIVLLFGAKKIPDLASGLGKGIKSFKKAVAEDDEVTTAKVEDKPAQPAQTATTTAQPAQTAQTHTTPVQPTATPTAHTQDTHKA